VTAISGPKVLPIKVINEPVEGIERENSARVLPSRAMAIAARIMVSGEPTPAVDAMSAELKKKLIAGAMLAMVEVAISNRLSAPRSRRETSIGLKVFPSKGSGGGDASDIVITSFCDILLYKTLAEKIHP
jgi:hypothetical protein